MLRPATLESIIQLEVIIKGKKVEFDEVKKMLNEMIAEQEKQRQQNIRHLILKKGPQKALQIIKTIAMKLNPNFSDNSDEIHNKIQALESAQGSKNFGKVTWKD